MIHNYHSILTSKRMRPSTVNARDLLMEAESDRGRIMFSPAFRRLQQKAQVFSMEPNAAVRSRLTHSFEVSQIGRYIATTIGARLMAEGGFQDEHGGSLVPAFVNFVENACLMHDIGNPPFGHFGEAAIRTWFATNGRICLDSAVGSRGAYDSDAYEGVLADFKEFDGNPQGLRIVCKLQWNNDAYGLNLTNTTLASYLKYVRMAGEAKQGDSKFLKKAGYFSTESDIVHGLWRDLGYFAPQRFPLAYIMEAADDIAYCISDLEDSIEKGVVTQSAAMQTIRAQWEGEIAKMGSAAQEPNFGKVSKVLQSTGEERFTYTNFRTQLNNIIVPFGASQYIEQHDEIAAGTCPGLLPENSAAGIILRLLKDYCVKHVYCHDSVHRTELAGYAAISGLLAHFEKLLVCSAEDFGAAMQGARRTGAGEEIIVEGKLLHLFPEKYKKVYAHDVAVLRSKFADLPANFFLAEWNARAHLVVDFLSGMTDDFAMTSYRTLSGMQV